MAIDSLEERGYAHTTNRSVSPEKSELARRYVVCSQYESGKLSAKQTYNLLDMLGLIPDVDDRRDRMA